MEVLMRDAYDRGFDRGLIEAEEAHTEEIASLKQQLAARDKTIGGLREDNAALSQKIDETEEWHAVNLANAQPALADAAGPTDAPAGEVATEDTSCRRCSECVGEDHHWMDTTAWSCKHCNIVIPMCESCRRCSECVGEDHHWMDTTAWSCKHCNIVIPMCDTCVDAPGANEGPDGFYLCDGCKEHADEQNSVWDEMYGADPQPSPEWRVVILADASTRKLALEEVNITTRQLSDGFGGSVGGNSEAHHIAAVVHKGEPDDTTADGGENDE
jgi:hypothetical protein